MTSAHRAEESQTNTCLSSVEGCVSHTEQREAPKESQGEHMASGTLVRVAEEELGLSRGDELGGRSFHDPMD